MPGNTNPAHRRVSVYSRRVNSSMENLNHSNKSKSHEILKEKQTQKRVFKEQTDATIDHQSISEVDIVDEETYRASAVKKKKGTFQQLSY